MTQPVAPLFGTIGYEKAGEYHYVVNEVKGDDKTITYDDHEYDVTVRVTDDLKGSLVAAVEYPEGVEGIVFHNVYTKPVEPSKPAEPAQPAKPGASGSQGTGEGSATGGRHRCGHRSRRGCSGRAHLGRSRFADCPSPQRVSC